MKHRKRLLTLALLCVGLAVLLYCLRRPSPTPLPPIVLLSPGQLPPLQTPRFARIIPYGPKWAWAWRLREKLLGPPKPVRIEAAALRLGLLNDPSGWSPILPKPDLVAPDGLQLWGLSASDTEAFRRKLKEDQDTEFLFASRAFTSFGSSVGMANGGSVTIRGLSASVGLALDVRPARRGPVTDLTASILWREAVTNPPSASALPATPPVICLQTNLCVSGRFQLSNACSVLFLYPAAGFGQKPLGLLLSVTQAGPQGTRLQTKVQKR